MEMPGDAPDHSIDRHGFGVDRRKDPVSGGDSLRLGFGSQLPESFCEMTLEHPVIAGKKGT